MMKWIKTAISGLALLLIFMALPGHAQTEVWFSALEVDLWPEYDRPEVLVIYRITLAPDVSLPVDLTLRIPAAVGDPSAVAIKQVTSSGESGLFTIPFERQLSGEWGLVSLTATMPEIQFEYYDPGMIKEGTSRHFEYRWPGDYAVDSLSIQVLQPVGAWEMRISPATDPGTPGEKGLVYYNKQVGSMSAGQTFELSFDYKKQDPTLSAADQQVQPIEPPDEGAIGQNSLKTVLPWALGILGLALILGGGVWYWKSGKGGSGPTSRRRHKPAAREETGTIAEGYVYCHQCGKRATPGDRFCRTCGTKLRLSE